MGVFSLDYTIDTFADQPCMTHLETEIWGTSDRKKPINKKISKPVNASTEIQRWNYAKFIICVSFIDVRKIIGPGKLKVGQNTCKRVWQNTFGLA